MGKESDEESQEKAEDAETDRDPRVNWREADFDIGQRRACHRNEGLLGCRLVLNSDAHIRIL
jgi:hypothetical protein